MSVSLDYHQSKLRHQVSSTDAAKPLRLSTSPWSSASSASSSILFSVPETEALLISSSSLAPPRPPRNPLRPTYNPDHDDALKLKQKITPCNSSNDEFGRSDTRIAPLTSKHRKRLSFNSLLSVLTNPSDHSHSQSAPLDPSPRSARDEMTLSRKGYSINEQRKTHCCCSSSQLPSFSTSFPIPSGTARRPMRVHPSNSPILSPTNTGTHSTSGWFTKLLTKKIRLLSGNK
ncbi:hypothetical protein PCANC_07502 [Puccinia coronata f. sp. avenae]|nr:hypothetical protein PCANC_07502 [Puccinia coronata f. sp. avenae]